FRAGRSERRGALGARRVDRDGGYRLLTCLCCGTDQLHLSLPASCEQGTSLAQVKAGDIDLLVIGARRQAKQLGGRVVAGESAEARRVLTRHQGEVAAIVARGLAGVAGGENAGDIGHAQIAIDEQTAEMVALSRDL